MGGRHGAKEEAWVGGEASILAKARRWRKKLLALPLAGSLYAAFERGVLAGLEAWLGFRTDPMDYPFFRLQLLLGRHEPETVAYVRSILRKGGVAVDVGAHVGYYTRLFARLAGEDGLVLAVEPNPRNLALLRANLARHQNVRLAGVAVSPQAGTVELDVPERATGWGRIRLDSSASSWGEDPRVQRMGASAVRYQVPAKPLSALLEEVGLAGKAMDLLKVDTEGAEAIVLDSLGSHAPWVQRVVCELGPANLRAFGHTPIDLLERLEGMGFARFRILDPVAGDGYPYPLPGVESAWLTPRTLRGLLGWWNLEVEGLVMNLVAERDGS